MYFINASDGTVAPVDFFSDIDIIFDGNTINLDQSMPVHTRRDLVVQDDEIGAWFLMTLLRHSTTLSKTRLMVTALLI